MPSSSVCRECSYFHLNPEDPGKNGYCYGIPPVAQIMMMQQQNLISAQREMVPQTVSVEAIVNYKRPACHLFKEDKPQFLMRQ